MDAPVLISDQDAVCTIPLNRPERMNALSPELIEALRDALRRANARDSLRAIVLTGAGDRAFCAGDDLRLEDRDSLDEATVRAQVEALQGVTREILLGPKPVIGAINGWAVGGGFEIALNCDFPIWAEGARGFFPELRWGLFVTGAVTALLPAMVGPVKAREMLMLGDKYEARELARLGLAWKAVSPARLLQDARELAETLAALPPRGVAEMKRQLRANGLPDLDRVLADETAATVAGACDPETLRRISAFGSAAG